LDVHPEHGQHGEAAILEFLGLELNQGVRVFGESEGVEGLPGVEGVRGFPEGPAGQAIPFRESHEEDLEEGNRQDGLGVDQGGVP